MARPFPPGICIIVTRRCVSVFAAYRSSAVITIAMNTAVDTYQLGPVLPQLVVVKLFNTDIYIYSYRFTLKLTMCSHFFSPYPLCYCFHNKHVFHKTLMMPVVQTSAHNCSPWVHHCHLAIGIQGWLTGSWQLQSRLVGRGRGRSGWTFPFLCEPDTYCPQGAGPLVSCDIIIVQPLPQALHHNSAAPPPSITSYSASPPYSRQCSPSLKHYIIIVHPLPTRPTVLLQPLPQVQYHIGSFLGLHGEAINGWRNNAIQVEAGDYNPGCLRNSPSLLPCRHSAVQSVTLQRYQTRKVLLNTAQGH